MHEVNELIRTLSGLSPWFLLIAVLATFLWFERRRADALESAYKQRDKEINEVLGKISLSLELIKDHLK